MATILGYTTLSEALQSIDVTYELLVDYDTDSYRPKVYAPRYNNKEYMLDLWYSTSLPIEDVHNDVMINLAIRYGIRPETVWTSS